MIVLKKDALIALLGDELYGIELDYAMLCDIEKRATERREVFDIVGDLCEVYGYNRREVQKQAQDRLEGLLLRKDEIDDWDPFANIKLTELSKLFFPARSCIPSHIQL